MVARKKQVGQMTQYFCFVSLVKPTRIAVWVVGLPANHEVPSSNRRR